MNVVGNKKQFQQYLFEFIVLFGSIYIAFELEEWDENQDFTDREEAYLASLHQDLRKDLNQLNRRVYEYDEKIQGAYNVLQLLDSDYKNSRPSIVDEYKSHLQYHFNYNPVNNTLVTLRTSGDLKLVKNHKFKILLSELDKSYAVTLNQGEIFNHYIEGNEWSGFFINNFDVQDLTIFRQNPNLTILFKNKVRHYITLIESYYFHMQGTLNKIEEVKIALEAEMKRRELSYDPGNKSNDEPVNDIAEDSLSDDLDELLEELDGTGEEQATSNQPQSTEEATEEDLLDDLLEDLDEEGI